MERFEGQKKQLCSKVSFRSLEVQGFTEDQSFFLEEDTIPFLQMLQQTGDTSLSCKEPNFLALLSLQKPWELESYLSHEVPDFHSPIQSQTNQIYQNQASTTSMEQVNEAISSQELLLNPLDDILNQTNLIPVSTSPSTANSRRKRKMNHLKPEMGREKRKRKRTKPTKNIEEIENQRMTHIAVERNRRRQMNDHLNSLRTLIPPSYIHRGDQASIVGGAIDFVKVLEQLLQSLEAQKITQQNGGNEDEQEEENKDENPENKSLRDISSNDLRTIKEEQTCNPKIDATVVQNHVNLTIQCHRKQGQLLKAIILLDELRLTVLHLNITSPSHTTISYSFNLKIEEDCKLGSGDEIAAAMSQMFSNRID